MRDYYEIKRLRTLKLTFSKIKKGKRPSNNPYTTSNVLMKISLNTI